jgi:tetratricopeptide (TPR) repeat protein
MFTGRDTYLQLLERHFCNDGKYRKSFLLYGLGGIGKTQICLQFIAQNKEWYLLNYLLPLPHLILHIQRFSDIFWIDASDEASIDLRLKQIAKKNNMNDISAESALQWISSIGQNWLIVFDNADGIGYEIVEKYLPPEQCGNILITSRNWELSRITLESIEVCEMAETEAISLLLNSASIVDNSPSVKVSAAQIVSELGYIPLAIDQAGAYIHAHGCGLDSYLELYSKQCRELMSNSSFQGASKYGKSTYVTWEIPMKEIESRAATDSGKESIAAQSAVILFHYFAFMHHNEISEDIFKNAAENYRRRDIGREKKLGLPLLVDFLDSKALFLNSHWNELQFRAGIQVLLSFSLIKPGSHNGVYSIHPLIHAWSRDRMSSVIVQSSAYYKAAALLSCSIEPIEHDKSYESCMHIIPHIRACYTHAQKLQLKIIGFDDEWGRFAFAFHRTRNWAEAKQLYKCMMKKRIEKLGEDHSFTLTTMHNLASTYRRVGKLEKAENLELKVLDVRKAKLGEQHPDTLSSMDSLAIIYQKQGRMNEAEVLQLKVLERRKVALGEKDPKTLDVMHNLAVAYFNQGRVKDAENLQLAVLGERKATLEQGHKDTLSTMYNLALTYKEQGQMEEAEKLQVEVLKIRKEKLGIDHPDTLSASYSLALTYKEQGKVDMAEKLEVEVMNGRRAELGADHPDTLSIMHNLAVTYFNQGKIEEAEGLQLEVAEKRKVKLGAAHPDTLSATENLRLTQIKKEELMQLKKKDLDLTKAKKLKGLPGMIKKRLGLE